MPQMPCLDRGSRLARPTLTPHQGCPTCPGVVPVVGGSLRPRFRFHPVHTTACGPPFSLCHRPAPGSCGLLPSISLTLHATPSFARTSSANSE